MIQKEAKKEKNSDENLERIVLFCFYL